MANIGSLTNGGSVTLSSARIRRPLVTTSGFSSDLDETVKRHLDELNELLNKRIFEVDDKNRVTLKVDFNRKSQNIEITTLLKKSLTPKRTIPDAWDNASLLDFFDKGKENLNKSTLSEYVDGTPELSILKSTFLDYLSKSGSSLEYNVQAVLTDYPAITNYLVAVAFYIGERKEFHGLKNFIVSHSQGTKNVARYAIVSGARTLIEKKQLEVPHLNNDNSEIVNKIKAAKVSLSSASFETDVQSVIDDQIFYNKEYALIEDAEKHLGKIPSEIKPLLVQYIKHSPVLVTKQNNEYFLPLFISQIKGEIQIADTTQADKAESERDFDVSFLEDDKSSIQVNKLAVKCAAQLYYSMVLGDQLGVFDIMNYFSHKYLIRGGILIEDRRLREDIQQYVFSNKFTNLKTKKLTDRTRPAERQMFYRQAFNEGSAEVTEDLIVNREFSRLWKVLMLETAKYIERAQDSPNPERFVSPQNIMQAVEDLQYNLSTHATGMVNVITPLIYAEIEFVIRRILKHPEVLRQIVPSGGTWWRVVETLYMAMKNVRPKATVFNNKARLGYAIIQSIANYTPSKFEEDKTLLAFISDVDAFITTQSILQEALTDELIRGEKEEEEEESNGDQTEKRVPVSPGSKAEQDEWDF
ncbi:MAG: hypothetical protein CV087_04995 [Candidatus Brocadia sp. WS118]|nr:MAG: hypothetical protein CV087_04995 [Candidatus Brocadia sp. WS118]